MVFVNSTALSDFVVSWLVHPGSTNAIHLQLFDHLMYSVAVSVHLCDLIIYSWKKQSTMVIESELTSVACREADHRR
jgi:hypothetical protein